MILSTQKTRSRGRTATFLVSLASACLLALSAFADNVAKQVSGDVELGRGEPPQWRTLSAGDRIEPDDRIRTGADGRVEISMAAGSVRVHENSMLRLPSASENADRVDLEEGNSLFDVLRRAGRRFEVHTPTVVVSVKGTRFGVDATGDVGEVAVYRGMVGVREAGMSDALETLVREGFLATGGPGHAIELDLAPEGDPWASWQDFGREIGARRERPSRANDLDQARAVLHRATNAEVLQRAAERKPEVAERLRAMKREADKKKAALANDDSTDRPDSESARDRMKARMKDRMSDEGRPVPASPAPSVGPGDPADHMNSVDPMGSADPVSVLPDATSMSPEQMGTMREKRMMMEMARRRNGGASPGGDESMMRRTMMREMAERQTMSAQDDYARKMEELAEEDPATINELIEDPNDPDSSIGSAAALVASFTQQQIEFIMQAKNMVWMTYYNAAGPGGTIVPPTPGQFLVDLEQAFITMGKTPAEAAWLINELQNSYNGS